MFGEPDMNCKSVDNGEGHTLVILLVVVSYRRLMPRQNRCTNSESHARTRTPKTPRNRLTMRMRDRISRSNANFNSYPQIHTHTYDPPHTIGGSCEEGGRQEVSPRRLCVMLLAPAWALTSNNTPRENILSPKPIDQANRENVTEHSNMFNRFRFVLGDNHKIRPLSVLWKEQCLLRSSPPRQQQGRCGRVHN